MRDVYDWISGSDAISGCIWDSQHRTFHSLTEKLVIKIISGDVESDFYASNPPDDIKL